MVKPKKLLWLILSGSKNVAFKDMVRLAETFGFKQVRVRGSHHIFSHPEVTTLLNLQNVGGQAKPYQVRQFLKLVERHDLRLEER